MASFSSGETPGDAHRPVTVLGPDFPFAFDDWIDHPAGLGTIPAEHLGAEVAIVGAGIAGVVAAYEPVSYTHLTLPTTPYV